MSAFLFNHGAWFVDPPRTGPKWEPVRKVEVPVDDESPQEPDQQAG